MSAVLASADLSSLASMDAASKPQMLPILTVKPAKLPDASLLVQKSKRESKNQETLTEADRFRGVIVPESSLMLPDGACTSKFQLLLQQTIHSLAQACFASFLAREPLAREIPAALLTLDGVLRFASEERVRSQIDGPKILAWLQASETWKTLSDAQKKGWTDKLPKLAAPSYRAVLSQSQAAVVASRIADADLESAVCEFVMLRLRAIMDVESDADAL